MPGLARNLQKSKIDAKAPPARPSAHFLHSAPARQRPQRAGIKLAESATIVPLGRLRAGIKLAGGSKKRAGRFGTEVAWVSQNENFGIIYV